MNISDVPSYCLKKNSKGKKYAYIYLNGKRIGLGPDSIEAKQKYNSIIAEWLANGKCSSDDGAKISIEQMCRRFLVFASDYYSGSTEYGNYETVAKILIELYGAIEVDGFGPQKLDAVRQVMIKKGWQRKSINKQIIRVKGIFKWAESREIIEKGMYEYLSTLASLRKGRCPGVAEGKKVKPVPEEDIEIIRHYVSRHVWAMIQLQLLTGARPGEIIALRMSEVDNSGDIWIFLPEKHKNEYREMEREIYIGRQAQSIILGFLFGKTPDEYIFSPKDANREIKQRYAIGHRREDQKPSCRKTDRQIGDKYTVASYRRAIHRACEKAGINKWSPHQLRHNAATIIRKEYGIEAAQVILGHARADVTQIYAERDREKAMFIASKLG